MKVLHDPNDALVEHACPQCGCVHTHKFEWDWGKFFRGKADNKLLAYLITTTLIVIILFTTKAVSSEFNERILLAIWGGATAIYMIPTAISKAVGNAKLEARIGG